MAKPIFIKNKGETIVHRPNMLRCRYVLSNGQLLSMFFTRHRVRPMVGRICYVWTVCAYIGKSRKEANRWFNTWKRENPQQTGTCGLEGLNIAVQYIQSFGETRSSRSEVRIHWTDPKRMRAYMRLLRYPGFTLYKENGKPQCIAYHNPEIYEWVKESG